jgi:hypothetical protein
MSTCSCATGCACSKTAGLFSRPSSCQCTCHDGVCTCRRHRSRGETQTARNNLNEVAGYLGLAADADGRYGSGR